jgi:ABC-type transport system involved in Fe-S cluster assembly fused permease/ATPase subunit
MKKIELSLRSMSIGQLLIYDLGFVSNVIMAIRDVFVGTMTPGGFIMQ